MFNLKSIKEVSKEIGVPTSTLYSWKRRKQIPPNIFLKIGGSVFVKTDMFTQWVENQ